MERPPNPCSPRKGISLWILSVMILGGSGAALVLRQKQVERIDPSVGRREAKSVGDSSTHTPERENPGFDCHACGKHHDELPMSFGPEAPLPWDQIPAAERS